MHPLQCQKISPTNIVFVTLSFLQESLALDSAQQVDPLLHLRRGNSSILEEWFTQSTLKRSTWASSDGQ